LGQVLSGTVRVTVAAPPIAEPTNLTVAQSSSTDIDVLMLVLAPAGSIISTQSVTQPPVGTSSVRSSGTVRYVAPASDFGTFSFTYTVTDNLGQTSSAEITVNVVPAPKAVADTRSTVLDTPVTVPVLANDTGHEVSVLNVDPATNGTISVVAEEVRFTPNAGWFGTEVFNYTIRDSLGQTSVASVTVHVFPTLIAQNASVTTTKVSAVQVPFNLPFGSVVTSLSQTPHGTFEIRQNGSIWFTPNGAYVGSFTVQYAIEDGAGQTATASLHVTVTDITAVSSTDMRGVLQKTGSSSGAFLGTVSLAIAAILSGLLIRRRRRG